jgi:hypothetical protein
MTPTSHLLVRYATLVLLAVASWAAGAAATALPEGEAAAGGCFRTRLEPPPLWVSSLSWRPDQQGWILPDVGSGVLRLVASDGRPAGERSAPGPGRLEYVKPSHLVAIDGGYLLADGGSRLLWLDDSLRPTRSIDLGDPPTRRTASEIALFKWSATPSGRVYAYCHVLGHDEEWWTGFAEIVLEPDLSVRQVVDVDNRSAEAAFYSLANPFVATIGERGYLLRMGNPPHLVEAGPTPRRLRAFPEGFASRPTLPRPSAENATLVFKVLAQSKMATGLLAWGDHLYVLTREAVRDGTSWSLTKIDPRRDAVVHTVELPTRAADLVLAPGPQHWAILEKGEIQVIGIQKMIGLLFVPSQWITAGTVPAAESPGAACEVRDAR